MTVREQLPNLWSLLPFVLLTLAGLRWPRWFEGGSKTWNGPGATDSEAAEQSLAKD